MRGGSGHGPTRRARLWKPFRGKRGRGGVRRGGPCPGRAGHEFFDDIRVMTPDPAVKAAWLGLLASARATAPAGVDWRALDLALGS